jgi:hypothetical protein
MELTAKELLAFIIPVIGVVAWLIRLEAKALNTEKTTQETKDKLSAHEARTEIHHNPERFAEFEKRMDERFGNIQTSVGKVESYVEEIDSKLERFLLKGEI